MNNTEALPKPTKGSIDTDGVFPEWKAGNSKFKYWCHTHFGPDADESYLAEAILLLPRKEELPMTLADEFELRRLLAEERYTVRQMSRALRDAIEAPTFMWEPVSNAAKLCVAEDAEIERLRADAARYQWLRLNAYVDVMKTSPRVEGPNTVMFDDTIDAAMLKESKS